MYSIKNIKNNSRDTLVANIFFVIIILFDRNEFVLEFLFLLNLLFN